MLQYFGHIMRKKGVNLEKDVITTTTHGNRKEVDLDARGSTTSLTGQSYHLASCYGSQDQTLEGRSSSCRRGSRWRIKYQQQNNNNNNKLSTKKDDNEPPVPQHSTYMKFKLQTEIL